MKAATQIEDLIVVGGGDAGKLAALIFEQENPSLTVSVIDDMAEPPKEVGKSTFSSITWILHNKLDIDSEEFVQQVNPVWKHSVYLQDWTGTEFFTPFDIKHVMDKADKPLENVHYRYQNDNFTTVNELATLNRKTPFIEAGDYLTHRYFYPHVAYHLNIHKFNKYLSELMEQRGINVIDDRIKKVNTEEGWITSVESATSSYEADLYIDATGFKRVLASELPLPFSNYDFLLDSALVTQLPITLEEIVPATVVKTLDNGWAWQIDTTDSRDLGYVYSSAHTTRDAAERAFREAYDIPESANLSRHEFTSGKFDRAWMGNCIIAGDAYGFVEPLQATSLSTHAHIMCDVVNLLTNHSWVMHDGLRSIVNNLVNTYWREIYNFLSIFYRNSWGETEFWQDMQSIGDPEQWSKYEREYRTGTGFILSKAKWTESELTFGKVFNIYQSDLTLYQLGVPIELHESNNLEISAEVIEHVEDETEEIKETVANFLTYPEVYSQQYFGEPKQLDIENNDTRGGEFDT
jgi:tryptophan halogenase